MQAAQADRMACVYMSLLRVQHADRRAPDQVCAEHLNSNYPYKGMIKYITASYQLPTAPYHSPSPKLSHTLSLLARTCTHQQRIPHWGLQVHPCLLCFLQHLQLTHNTTRRHAAPG
jgi:hypothetical protein